MTDKIRRKQIRDELRLKARNEFEAKLPMSKDKFKSLFDYLNLALQNEKCSDDHDITSRFLNLIGLSNVDDIVAWLIDNDGYCDCETLANVEELFLE
jgi:Protein of unknown function (DUF2695)